MNGVFPSDVYGLIIDRIELRAYGGGKGQLVKAYHNINYVGNLLKCMKCDKENIACVHLMVSDNKAIMNLMLVCKSWKRHLKAKHFKQIRSD